MNAADTSVVVAAFASWHEKHQVARRALDRPSRLIEHCALETYSVLTRLPAPHRAAAAIVSEFLADRFPLPLLRLSRSDYRKFLRELPAHEVTGGAVYDALVAATASAHRAELITCDRRAVPVYERYGVSLRVL